MSQRLKCAVIALQWSLGIVILIEAVLFLMPGTRHDFGRVHIPDLVRLILGWGEIIGAILLLIPRMAGRGAWILIGVFVFAIFVHLLHGMFNVGNLVIYTAAAFVIAAGKSL